MPDEYPEPEPEPTPTGEAPVSNARYLVQESIGHGGMGQVFRAWDQHLGRNVAIKRISEDPGVDAAVRREAGILAGLHHPNIVTIFDFAADEIGPFVVMEYVEGRTLEDLVLGQPLEVPNFLELVTQVCRGLSSAHTAGLVHLDLKPGNIMLQLHRDGSFTSKILDFGLAKAGGEAEGKGELYGSPYTVAPEQLAQEPTDARTDIYSLGCVFYFALSGKNAFEAPTVSEILTRHMEGRVTPLHLAAPKVPPGISQVIGKMLAALPADRPQTVEEARSLLLKASRGPAPSPAGAPRPVTGRQPSVAAAAPVDKDQGGIFVTLAVLVLVGSGAWWYYGPKQAALNEAATDALVPAQTAAAAAVDRANAPVVDAADAAALTRQFGRMIVAEGTVESVVESKLFHAHLLKFANVPAAGAVASVREDVLSAEQVQAYAGKHIRVMGKLSGAAGIKRVIVEAPSDLTVAGP